MIIQRVNYVIELFMDEWFSDLCFILWMGRWLVLWLGIIVGRFECRMGLYYDFRKIWTHSEPTAFIYERCLKNSRTAATKYLSINCSFHEQPPWPLFWQHTTRMMIWISSITISPSYFYLIIFIWINMVVNVWNSKHLF